jgi:hypothetical protein
LHKGLSTSPTKINSNAQYDNRTSKKCDNNDKQWKDWWKKKMEASIYMITKAKEGNYEEMAKLIDINFNKDFAASVNY